ncbi:hypothetical protein M8C21_026988 [Ambrosia artemisiifolia]|uniref:NB-ARC domain-containing protein n=1 Tax=Ambrosia artemisiifolia TaxID=4212 RepID=A0AAD5GUL4_AMBAR|nr:hypothetical protein M8C21_026988 [Ambrosia artemisiifolia]
MEDRIEVINFGLKHDLYNAIAICVMGGSGKTTVAQCIYNLNNKDFKSSSFIQDIGKQPDGMLGLQKQLLRDLLGGKKIKISNVSEATHKIEQILHMKKVLIVLDDIDKHEQLSALLGTKAFPTQSKIIIITRLLDIQTLFGSVSLKCHVNKIKLLDDLESLELLSWYAFRSKTPMEGFKELAIQLAQYCGGNPLALKVLGDLDCNIQSVLRRCFDSLPLRSHKELFLHIACFFVGEYEFVTEMILEEELYAKSGILTLIRRSLLTISANRKLMMHQLLQEMGRSILCEESKDPTKRSRVWHDTESYHVLRKGDGSNTIEGLTLDMRKVEQGMRSEVRQLK